MLKYYSSYILVYSGFTHLLCCGIPFFLSFNALLANTFFYESIVFNLELFESAEIYLLVFTSIIFIILITSEIINKKLRCSRDDDCCEKLQCDSTKKSIKFNIILSSALYLINLFLFAKESDLILKLSL